MSLAATRPAGAARPPAAAPLPGRQPAGRVGPNAVVRLAEALDAGPGADTARRVFARAALEPYLTEPPFEMVDEREVARLYRALWDALPEAQVRAVARDAGRRTGDYLLAHRIPKPVQRLLKLMPASWAGAVLLKAVARNAWTFAGSGQFAHGRIRSGFAVDIAGCPLAADLHRDAPVCDMYAGTFERLFRVLVRPDATVEEVTCSAAGADACRFRIGL
jgi:divinyl protochlorophyllide a 8-vinyl-reductase